MQKINNGKGADIKLMDPEYPDTTKEQSIRLGRIINANYEKDDLEQEVNKLIHLTKSQQLILPSCLKRYEDTSDSNID